MRAGTLGAMPRGSRRLPAARDHRPHTAFVLSGGASLAAVQVGMLQALYEHGIAADLLVGTSAGAINAAFIASRPQTTATGNPSMCPIAGSADTFPANYLVPSTV